MSYEEEELVFNQLSYQGNRINCNECLHCPNHRNEDTTQYMPCKMIDHDKFRLYKSVFNGYQGSISTCNICKHFEPAKWNISCQNEWKGLEAYIEFMDKFFYMTPSFLEYNKIRDSTTGGVTICVGGYDTYGEIQYCVALYDWLTGEWFRENKLKYIRKYKVIRTPTGRTKGRKIIEHKGIDDMTEFLKTNKCDYLLGGKL